MKRAIGVLVAVASLAGAAHAQAPAAAEGMSYEDIARIMDCPIGTVRSRIFRAREAISDKLKPLLDTAKDKRW